ncbi:MAG: amidase family protein [Candidatus Aenigmatarchaeota archaeon]
MKYKGMSVEEFLNSEVDLEELYSELREELQRIEKDLELVRPGDEGSGDLKGEGKLKGLPVSLKDCICAKGMKSYAGSKILEGYRPPFDSTVAEKLKEDGANIIGKTHQDEFGFGTFSTNCTYAQPKNPWDGERSCGGSSGGAGGLTAALDFPHISIGESTGGSISNPASFCGVVGLTPTYGIVSRYGLISYGNSLDKIGPLGRTVEETAIGLETISGKDPRDQTSVESNGGYREALDKSVKGMNIGIPEEYLEGIDGEIKKKVMDAVTELENLGAERKDISLPMTEAALHAYYVVAMAESSTNLAKYCGLRYGLHEKLEGNFDGYFSKVRGSGFGDEAKRRVMLGTYTRMAGYREKYYLKALKVRRKVIQDFKRAFKDVDVLAAPAMPMVAPRFGEIEDLSPVEIYNLDKLTVPANFAGIPQISIPCGFKDGMPVGLHLLGDHFQEKKIINVASSYERGRGKIKYPEV